MVTVREKSKKVKPTREEILNDTLLRKGPRALFLEAESYLEEMKHLPLNHELRKRNEVLVLKKLWLILKASDHIPLNAADYNAAEYLLDHYHSLNWCRDYCEYATVKANLGAKVFRNTAMWPERCGRGQTVEDYRVALPGRIVSKSVIASML